MINNPVVVDLKRERKLLLIVLLGAIGAVSIVMLSAIGASYSSNLGDITRVATITTAGVLSVKVVSSQGVRGLFGRAYVGLAAGLLLWVCAESIWAYIEIVIGEKAPFPSIADALWLAAYGGFGYHLFALSKFFGKGVKRYKIAIVSIGMAIMCYYYVSNIISSSASDPTATPTVIAISIAYPVFDAILFIPAIVIVLNSGRGKLTSIPWIFIAWIILGIADSMLGFVQLTGFQGGTTFVTMTYNAAYLAFAAGLVWYLRFVISARRLVIKN